MEGFNGALESRVGAFSYQSLMPAGAGIRRYENWHRPHPLWIPAFAGMTNSVAGTIHFRTNRSCRLWPAHQGMTSGSCGLVQRIGAVDSAEPHPDPCGGQAPALHFLIPPSAIGLQFGTFRPWRAGIKVDWRANPGSESGTCFRTNR